MGKGSISPVAKGDGINGGGMISFESCYRKTNFLGATTNSVLRDFQTDTWVSDVCYRIISDRDTVIGTGDFILKGIISATGLGVLNSVSREGTAGKIRCPIAPYNLIAGVIGGNTAIKKSQLIIVPITLSKIAAAELISQNRVGVYGHCYLIPGRGAIGIRNCQGVSGGYSGRGLRIGTICTT